MEGLISLLPILLPVAVVCCLIYYLVESLYSRWSLWRELPTLEEYREKNPDCQTTRGVRCFECKSGAIWQHRLNHRGKAMFECRHCGTYLYKRP
nr:hypothetical protein [Halomonas socia]